MSNLVTNSEEALKKLNMRTGGISNWLSPEEVTFITDATGVIPLLATVVQAGPSDFVGGIFETPYEVPIYTVASVTVVHNAQSYTEGVIALEVETSGKLLARLASSFTSKYGNILRFETNGWVNIREITFGITARDGSDIELTDATLSIAPSGTAIIAKADATPSIQGYIDCEGLFEEGDIFTIDWTGVPGGVYQTIASIDSTMGPQAAAVAIASAINASDNVHADTDAEGRPDRIRFFAVAPDTTLNCDLITKS